MPVRHREGATGDQAPLAFDFHDAHAARAAGRQPLQVAKRRYADPCPAQRRKQHLSLLCLDRPSIHFNGYHAVSLIADHSPFATCH